MNWRVVGLFAFAITVWGLNYPFVKSGLSLAPPLWFAVLRVFVALVTAVALLFALGTKGQLTRRQTVIAMLLGIPGSAVFYGFWNIATTQIQPGLVSVFIYTYPLWTLFLSIPVLNEIPSTKRVGAALLGFLGVALTAQIGFVRVPASELGAIAELIVVGFGFGFLNVCFKRLFKGDQLIRANVWQMAGGLVVLTLWAGLTTPYKGIEWNLDFLLVLLWLGALGTACVYVAYFTLMSRYRASSLTSYFFLVVVVALVSSFFISGETINAVQAAGVAAIIAAIYLVGQSDKPKRTETLPAR